MNSVTAFAACLLSLCILAPAQAESLDLNFPEAISGAAFHLAAQTPRPTLLAFWRADCPPCLHDMPVLAAFAQQQNTLRVLGISLSSARDTRQQWLRLAMPFATLINTGFPGELLQYFGNATQAVPYTVVLRADRSLCWSALGALSEAQLHNAWQRCGDVH